MREHMSEVLTNTLMLEHNSALQISLANAGLFNIIWSHI